MKLATISDNLRCGLSVLFCPRCQRIVAASPLPRVSWFVSVCLFCYADLEIVEPHSGSAPAVAK